MSNSSTRSESTDPARLPIGLAATLLVGMGVLDAATSFLRYRVSGDFDPGWGYLAFEAVPWAAWLPVIPAAAWLVARVRPGEVGIPRCLGIHGAIAVAAAVAHAALSAAGRLLCGPAPAYATFGAQFEWLFPEFIPLNMAVYAAIVASFYAIDTRRAVVATRPGDGRRPTEDDATPRSLTRIAVRDGERVRFLAPAQVDWIEADGNYVRVHAGGEVYRIRATLSGTLARLDPDCFVRIHRSRVVNVRRVREIQPWFGSTYLAILDNGDRLGVSRGFRSELMGGCGS
ncbi:MAG: LytTR family DNA-binding domain-containing protein [Gemmatimonadota bacterium]|nr:LytTR family DNA-binding domain-containing protein [Gemmatimonadota bacterium]